MVSPEENASSIPQPEDVDAGCVEIKLRVTPNNVVDWVRSVQLEGGVKLRDPLADYELDNSVDMSGTDEA
jgi:hypothetical protein